MADLEKLAELIESVRSTCVNFGTAEHAVAEERIKQVEDDLGCKLPPSYLWFLRNYGGGEIGGDEVYSIYSKEPMAGGDIAVQYRNHLRSGLLPLDEIPFLSTDFGELFCMKIAHAPDGEFQIWLRRGHVAGFYAASFGDFLEKWILERSQ